MPEPLFTTSMLTTSAALPRQASVHRAAPAPALFTLSNAHLELKRLVGQLQPGQLVCYATGGKWAAHELLQYVLEQTGPARVTLSTWTMTEQPVRALRALREAGLITELRLLLDHRLKSRCPKAWQLVPSLGATVQLTRCHAKVTTIENDDWGVAIVGSQNYTRNPRIEAGTVFTDPAVARFHREWMEREIVNDKPFLR